MKFPISLVTGLYVFLWVFPISSPYTCTLKEVLSETFSMRCMPALPSTVTCPFLFILSPAFFITATLGFEPFRMMNKGYASEKQGVCGADDGGDKGFESNQAATTDELLRTARLSHPLHQTLFQIPLP